VTVVYLNDVVTVRVRFDDFANPLGSFDAIKEVHDEEWEIESDRETRRRERAEQPR
jgi:hypothetical protein